MTHKLAAEKPGPDFQKETPSSEFDEIVEEAESRQEELRWEIAERVILPPSKKFTHQGERWHRFGHPPINIPNFHWTDCSFLGGLAGHGDTVSLGPAIEESLQKDVPSITNESVLDVLQDIDSYSIDVKDEIVSEIYEMFDNQDSSELDYSDIFAINIASKTAEEVGHEEAVLEFRSLLDEYFKEDGIDIERVSRSSSDIDPVSLEYAITTYEDEAERIREATEAIYGDEDPDRIEHSIRIEQKQFLLLVLSKLRMES